MLATVLSDSALVIGALSAFVAAVGVLKAVGRAKRIEAKVGAAAVVIDGIDRVVNQQPKHAPTIPQRLDAISARVDDTGVRLERVADDVVDLHVRLDIIEAMPLFRDPPSSQGGQP